MIDDLHGFPAGNRSGKHRQSGMAVLRKVTGTVLSGLLIWLMGTATSHGAGLTVYSSRNASYLKPLFDEYSRDAGVAVDYLVAAPKALIARMETEGARGTADLLWVVGAGNLGLADAKGLLQPVRSRSLGRNVPEHLRSPNGTWFALSRRARTIVYHSGRVDLTDDAGYRELADERWKGRLCLTTSGSDYTIDLVSLLLARQGREATLAMLKGWVNNLAVAPLNEDAGVINAIQRGVCDIGIINSYYFARLQHDDPDTPLRLAWPDQDGSGVSLNLSGAGVSAHAPNPGVAMDFLEWMLRKRQQSDYAAMSLEYPVNPKVYPPRLLGKWGEFKADVQPLSNAWAYRDVAITLMQLAGYR